MITADIKIVWRLTRHQLLGMTRNRRAMIFTVVMPVLLLVLFNSIFVQGSDQVEVQNHQVAASAYFTGGMIAYSMLLSGFNTLAVGLVAIRESGELKRLRGAPMPGWTFIAATVFRNVIQTGSVAVLMLLISHFAYGVDVPAGSAGAILVYVLLGTLVFAAAGIAVTATVKDVDSGTGLLSFFAFILSFVSSIFVPIDQLPSWLAEVARVFPVYHVAEGMQSALAQEGSRAIGSGNLAVLLIWGTGAVLIAVRTFKWEPMADR